MMDIKSCCEQVLADQSVIHVGIYVQDKSSRIQSNTCIVNTVTPQPRVYKSGQTCEEIDKPGKQNYANAITMNDCYF